MPGFEYEIIRRLRRRTASICVKADNTVIVSVPALLSQKKINQLVQEKSDWIQRRLKINHEMRQKFKPKAYVSGEALPYLGRNYRLQLIEGVLKPASLSRGRLVVQIPPLDSGELRTAHIVEQLTNWYQKQALNHLTEKTEYFAESIGVTPADIRVKSYKSRWGSCHVDGRIFYNWRIIMAPHAVIDYLVVHELCHLIHHNHSREFWQQVESAMPDYRAAKAWLKENGPGLKL